MNFWSKGFTLIEALLGLAAFFLLAALFPFVIEVAETALNPESRLQHFEWEVFSNQVKKEIRMSQRIETTSTTLLLSRDSDVILYEKYGTKLRRRVNYTGNETLLQNVETVQFSYMNSELTIKIVDIWKKEFMLTARSFVYVGS